MSSYRSGGIQNSPMRKGKNCPRCLQSIRVNGEAQLSYAGFSFIVRGNADVIIQEADGMYEDRNGFGCGEDPGPGYGRQSAARKRRVPYRRKSELPLDDPFCNSAETAENAPLDERADAATAGPSDEEIEVEAVKKRRPFAMICKQEPHDTSYGTVDLVNQLATSSGKTVQQRDVTAIETYTYVYGDGEEESGIPFPQGSSTPRRARGGAETAYNLHPGTMNFQDPVRRRRPANSNVYNYNYPTAVWQQMVNAGHPLYKSVSSITNAYVTVPSEHFLGGISLRDTFERVQQNILRSVMERRCRKPSIISAWRIVISSIVYAMLRCKEHIKIVTVREKSVANPLVDLTETPGDEKNVHRLLRLMRDLSGNIDNSDVKSWNILFSCLVSILKQTRRQTTLGCARTGKEKPITLEQFDALTGDSFNSRFDDLSEGEEENDVAEEGNGNSMEGDGTAKEGQGKDHHLREVDEGTVVVDEDVLH